MRIIYQHEQEQQKMSKNLINFYFGTTLQKSTVRLRRAKIMLR